VGLATAGVGLGLYLLFFRTVRFNPVALGTGRQSRDTTSPGLPLDAIRDPMCCQSSQLST